MALSYDLRRFGEKKAFLYRLANTYIYIYIYMEGKRCFATMFKTAKERLNYIITFLVLRFLEQCSLRSMAVLVGRAK